MVTILTWSFLGLQSRYPRAIKGCRRNMFGKLNSIGSDAFGSVFSKFGGALKNAATFDALQNSKSHSGDLLYARG